MKHPVALGRVAILLSAIVLACGTTKKKNPFPPAKGGSGGEETGGSGGGGSGGRGGSGGGGSPDASSAGNKIELKIAWWGSQTRADRTNMVARMFEAANPTITIKTEFFATTQGMGIPGTDYWPTMNKYASDNTLPDIMQHDYAYIEEWTGRSLLKPLDELMSTGALNLADVPKGLIDGGKVKGKVMAISLGTNTQAMVVDLDLFTKLKLGVPNDDWTWDDFERIAGDIKAKEGIFGVGSGIWGYTPGWKAVFLSLGKWVFSDDGRSLGYTDDQPWIDHFKMLLRLKTAGALPKIAEEPTGTNVDGLLMVTKRSGMEHIFSNQLVGMATAANMANGGVARNFKMLPLPRVKNGKSPIYMKPSQYWAITQASKHPIEAAKFIEFFTNNIEANKILAGERGVPVNTKVLAALKTSLDKISAESFDLIERGGAYATALPPNDPPPWTNLLNTVLTPISKDIMDEKVTAEAGVAAFRTQATALLAGAATPDGGVPPTPDSAVPDAAPDARVGFEIPPGLRALLVVGDTQDATDAEIRARLERRVVVDLIPESQATITSAQGKALVVITASASQPITDVKFRDVQLPVILLEPNLFPAMRFTANVATDHGTVAAQTQVAITAPDSPLAAGLTGTVNVYTQPFRLVFGIPAANAIKVATAVGNANQAAIFAYPAGAPMVGGNAPAKRVGFFIHNNAAANNITETGFQLLDGAVEWSLAP
jgi:multiple sugar transport system substrate-binding protein